MPSQNKYWSGLEQSLPVARLKQASVVFVNPYLQVRQQLHSPRQGINGDDINITVFGDLLEGYI